ADLDSNLKSLNKWLVKRNQPVLSQDDLLIKLFNEVEYIWPMLGYPPLVTPFSQYVKNLALMNVLQIIKGRERWSMIADNIWDMIIGKSGELPGELSEEIKSLALKEGKIFYTGVPQDLYPDNLDVFRKEMTEKNWDFGQDDEELLELAMHPEQYRAYKSGLAKKEFEVELAKKRAPKEKCPEAPKMTAVVAQPKTIFVDVNGEKYKVGISYDENETAEATPVAETKAPEAVKPSGATIEIIAPLEGKFMLTKDNADKALKVGDEVKEGDLVCYIESMKTYNAIVSEKAGKVVEILVNNGDSVDEDDVLIKLA
ncbi:MAG: oxaloacetate decarboxylase, partial [Bacteroidetes bacterium]|nr:oxaloacetate decarboxylase [Bacteroidota bacterium]